MDILTAVGFVLALVAVLVGAVLKGAGISALLSSAAFMIVVVGTVASIFIQTPLPVFKHAMRRVSWIFKPPPLEAEALIKKIVEWSNIARKQGLLGLEPMIERETDSFMKRGLQLVVDGGEPDAIRAILEVEVGVREHADTRAAKVFEGMGIYSPTLGIIGAVLGLMAVMQNLADPSKLGHGIAAAFTATVYGARILAEHDRHAAFDDHFANLGLLDRARRESARHRIQASRFPALMGSGPIS